MGEIVKQPHGGAIYQASPGETRNPFGRPKKILTEILEQMKLAGYKRVTPDNVAEAYELLIALKKDDILKIINDKDQPAILAIVARAMMTKKGVEMLERMLDRAHGKPKQNTTNELVMNQSTLAILFGIADGQENNTEDTRQKGLLAEKSGRDDRDAVAARRGQSPITKDVDQSEGSGVVGIPKSQDSST